jgi:ribosomal protein S27E
LERLRDGHTQFSSSSSSSTIQCNMCISPVPRQAVSLCCAAALLCAVPVRSVAPLLAVCADSTRWPCALLLILARGLVQYSQSSPFARAECAMMRDSSCIYSHPHSNPTPLPFRMDVYVSSTG